MKKLKTMSLEERVINRPDLQAHHTSWARDPDSDNYVLVLHDMYDKPMASVTYSYDDWLVTFRNLCSWIALYRKKRNP